MSIENIKKLREITGAGMLDVKKALDATNQNIDEAIKWLRENGISKAAKKSDRIAAEGIIKIAHNSKKLIIAEINSETDFVASNEKFILETNKIIDGILNSNIKSIDEIDNVVIDGNNVTNAMMNLTAIIGEKISLRRIEIIELDNKKVSSYVHSNSRIGTVIVSDSMDEEILKDIAMHAAAMGPQYLSINDVPKEKIDEETKLAKKDLAEVLKNKPENVQSGMINGKVNKTLSEIVLLEQQFVKDNSKKIKDLQKNGKILEYVRYEVGEGIEKKEENFAEEVAKQIKSV